MSKSSKIFLKIPCSIAELKLDITLQCGQAFRWVNNSDGKWTGMIRKGLWSLHQDEEYLHCTMHNPSDIIHKEIESWKIESTSEINKSNKTKGLKRRHGSEQTIETNTPTSAETQLFTDIIKSYFRLNVNLQDLYLQWSDKDTNFKNVCMNFPGVRMLDQPPTENVFSFICSSNNNIARISQLVEKLCLHFGEKIMTLDGKEWHCFPTVEALKQDGVEEKLRLLAFGYRASYIHKSACSISEQGGEKWLESLKDLSYEDCRQQLCTLSGIGPKVSDCICLMSMNHLSSIPVDTHVYQIAMRDYKIEGIGPTNKTVTNRIYKLVSQHFQDLYGPYAGWAHSVLFSADLKKFSSPAKTKVAVKKKRKLK